MNCNNGYSGFISANGNIIKQERDTEPFIQVDEIHPNDYKTFAAKMPSLFVYVSAAFIVFSVITSALQKRKN